MSEPPFDLSRAQRWFAVEFNNEAWDLAELPSRTPEQTERMLLAAHASVAHWLAIGTPLNELRGMCLLATVQALAGNGEAAVAFAERCVQLCELPVADLTPFDAASVYGCAALAASIASADEQVRFRAQAESAAAKLPAEDRALFDKLYGAAIP